MSYSKKKIERGKRVQNVYSDKDRAKLIDINETTNYEHSGTNLSGTSTFTKFTNASTALSIEDKSITYNVEEGHILSDVTDEESFTIPYDNVVNGAKMELNLFATKAGAADLTLETSYELSAIFFHGRDTADEESAFFKQGQLLASVFGSNKIESRQVGGYHERDSSNFTFEYHFNPVLLEERQFYQYYPLYKSSFDKLGTLLFPNYITTTIDSSPYIKGNQKCEIKVLLNKRPVTVKQQMPDSPFDNFLNPPIPPTTMQQEVRLDLKAGKNKVAVTSTCEIEQYARGNLSNSFATRFKSLAFSLVDAGTHQPVTLVNYAPSEESRVSLSGQLAQTSPELFSHFTPVGNFLAASTTPTDVFEPVELLYSDLSDSKAAKIEGKVGVYKGTFYPKEIGKYEFMAMSRSNMMEHRGFANKNRTIEDKFLMMDAKFDNVLSAGGTDWSENGWVHADFSLIIDDLNVLQNRNRIDGLDLLPHNWNVGYFNVSKDLSKKGVPLVYSLLGNRGWKETLLENQPEHTHYGSEGKSPSPNQSSLETTSQWREQHYRARLSLSV